jgi:hypothetical protein
MLMNVDFCNVTGTADHTDLHRSAGRALRISKDICEEAVFATGECGS